MVATTVLPAHRTLVIRAAELIANYGLVVIVLCLPLEFTATFVKLQLVRWVIAGVGLAYGYLLLTRRRQLVVPRAASIAWVVLFIAVGAVSWLTTRAPGASPHVLDLLLYPVVGLLVANLAPTEEHHRRTWSALMVSALAVALLGAALYASGIHIWTPNPLTGKRVNITFADPNITARFLTLGACVATFMYSARQSRAWLPVATAVICAAVLPVTLSRSGMALFPVSLALVVLVASEHRRAGLIAIVGVVIFAASTGLNPDTRVRAADAAGTLVSAVTGTSLNVANGTARGEQAVTLEDNRRYLVAAGIQMFKDHPIQGVGFGGYEHALLTTYRDRFLPRAYTDSVSHTSFVTIIAELGVIGALLFIGFLVQLAREGLDARRERRSAALWTVMPITLIAPILLFSQFEARFFEEPYLWVALGLAYSAQVLAVRNRVRDAARKPHRAGEAGIERRASPRRRIEVA